MHYLLPPLLLLLGGMAHAHDHRSHEHDPLQAHVHGEARLDVALEGRLLELELHGPAVNFLGFERAPANAREQARLNAVRDYLAQPEKAFALQPADAGCTLEREAVTSDLFSAASVDEDHLALHDEEAEAAPADPHHDIHAYYQFACARPQVLRSLDLRNLFRQYPDLQVIEVQLIGPQGQKGQTLNPRAPVLHF